MRKFLTLEFIPANTDLALLVLRIVLGCSILGLHGWGKMMNLLAGKIAFADPIGIGETPTLLLAVFSEVVAAAFVVFGLCARLAALFLVATMGVAFFVVHGMKLTGTGNGEMALLFLAGFAVILIAGAGRYSVDRK